MEQYCRACKKHTVWHYSKALKPGLWVHADFPGDYSGPDVSQAQRGQTVSIGAVPARELQHCLKCTECGRSVGWRS